MRKRQLRSVFLAVSLCLMASSVLAVTPPAAAQNGSARLTPSSPQVLESAGEVVLTVSMWRAGQVAYRTFDGACRVTYSRGGSPPDATCSAEGVARAPKDYTATSGELVFTTGGSKTITIPIVDDDVAEGGEAFTLAAWEEANADPWLPRGDSVIVRINDDEGDTSGGNSAAPAAGSSTNTKRAGGESSGSAVGAGAAGTVDPATPTTATPPAVEPRAGPGFELTSEGAEPAPDRGGGGSTSGLAIGLGTAALSGVGALAVMRRRRRLSATQA